MHITILRIDFANNMFQLQDVDIRYISDSVKTRPRDVKITQYEHRQFLFECIKLIPQIGLAAEN